MIASSLPAGTLAGLVLGLLGAGGTGVGLPALLFLAGLRPHLALGTNAVGEAIYLLALAIRHPLTARDVKTSVLVHRRPRVGRRLHAANPTPGAGSRRSPHRRHAPPS